MIYAAIYPEKFESEKGNKLMQVFNHLTHMHTFGHLLGIGHFCLKRVLPVGQ
jgi:hypothetical protein